MMEWQNNLQRSILQEYLDGLPEVEGVRKGKAGLRRRLAEKYGLTSAMVQGVIENAVTEGLARNPGGGVNESGTYSVINYHVLAQDLRERVKLLEMKFQSLLDTFEEFLNTGDMEVFISQLYSKIRLFRKRGSKFKVHRKSEARGKPEVLEFLVDQKG